MRPANGTQMNAAFGTQISADLKNIPICENLRCAACDNLRPIGYSRSRRSSGKKIDNTTDTTLITIEPNSAGTKPST